MKINPHDCRCCVVDAEVLPVLYGDGKWKRELLPVCVCTHPKRWIESEAQGDVAVGDVEVLCDATMSGKCRLFELFMATANEHRR